MRPGLEQRFAEAIERLESVQLLLLAGDLTATGELDEAEALAEACRCARVPVVAVLGNHDWHGGHAARISAVLEGAGVEILDRSAIVLERDGTSIGVAGTKGFVGGFRESRLPDFGEPLLRRLYAETGHHVDARPRGLEDLAQCEHRVVLLRDARTPSPLL